MKSLSIFPAIGIIAFSVILNSSGLNAQNTAITDDDTYQAESSAMLDVKSDDKGILIPRLDFNNRPATPVNGLLIFVTTNGPQGDNAFYYFNGNDWKKLDIQSTNWSVTGNAGTVNGTNFIGTTDNIPLGFKVNNQVAGKIDPNGQVSLGSQSGLNNTNQHSVAMGYQSLSSGNSGDFNVAVGYQSLMSNTSGGVNTAVGGNSMRLNTTGNWCAAFGITTLANNTSGTHNTAIGPLALSANTIGTSNTATGYGSIMENISGIANSGFGMYSLKSLKSGNTNTAIGEESGYNLQTGSSNVFLGYRAGYNETGSNKLYIANSDVNPPLIYGDFSTGLVGIGTTSPKRMLDVRGDVVTYSSSEPYSEGVNIFNTGTNGNMGLNLHVGATGTVPSASTLKGYLRVNKTTGNIILGRYDGAMDHYPLEINWANGNIYLAQSEGNVGIGTTNPTAKLDVVGDVKVSGSIYTPGTVVQTIVNTSEVTSSINTTSFTEANPDYRVSITPKFENSIFLIEYSFSINTDMATNTIFQMQLIRDIGGTEDLIGVGPVNGNRNQTSYVSRPSNGTDGNDMQNVYMVAKDSGLSAGTTYTYGFKYRRETGGSGTCYFNYNKNDIDIYGFSGVMTMKITEIAQ